MDITWLGHSAFKLEESTGTTVITDPLNESTGYNVFNQDKVDGITISHNNFSYSALSKISEAPVVISTEGAFEVKGIHISSIEVNHQDYKGQDKSKSLIFRYRIDGVEVCHMGDVDVKCKSFLLEWLMPINVLIIPIGGKHTINAEQAKEYIDKIMPDIVIPMQYKTKEYNLNNDKLDDFLELFEEDDIIEIDGDSISFDRAQFDGETTQVVIFNK